MPSPKEYYFAAVSAANQFPGNGLTPLMSTPNLAVFTLIPSEGLYAAAYVTAEKQVIVAFGPTSLSLSAYGVGTVLADLRIVANANPTSFADIASFMTKVIQVAAANGIAKADVFTTGFSLGGVEAEYAAKVTGLGGRAFGAPGLPGNVATNSNFLNYLIYGDPIGNFSAELPPGKAAGATGDHYGAPIWSGTPTDQQAWTAALKSATGTPGVVAALALFAADILRFHSLAAYANALGLLGVAAPPSGGAITAINGHHVYGLAPGQSLNVAENGAYLAMGASGDKVTLGGTGDIVQGFVNNDALTMTLAGASLTVDGGKTASGGGIVMSAPNQLLTLDDIGMYVAIKSTGETVSGAGAIVNVTPNSGEVVALTNSGTGDQVTLSGNDVANLYGAGGFLTVYGGPTTAGGGVNLLAAGQTAILAAPGKYVGVYAPNDVINGSGGTLAIAANSSATINGTDTVILGGAGAYAVVNNSTLYDQTTALVGLTGNGDIVNMINGGHLQFTGSDTFNANAATITINGGSSATINGAGDVVSQYGAYAALSNGTLYDYSSSSSLVGSGDVVNMAAGAALSVFGNDTFNAGSNTFYLGGGGLSEVLNGSGNTVSGSSDWITLATPGASNAVNGNGDTIVAVNGANVGLTGNNLFSGNADGISLAPNWTETINGNNDTVWASGDTMSLGGSGDIISGANDWVNLAPNTSTTFQGSNHTANATQSDTITISNGTIRLPANASNVTVNGNFNTFILGTNDSVTINGSYNLLLANYDALLVNGSGNGVFGGANLVATSSGGGNFASGAGNVGTGSTGLSIPVGYSGFDYSSGYDYSGGGYTYTGGNFAGYGGDYLAYGP